jgi:hypothetical protein
MKGSRGPAKGLDSQALDWLLASDEPGIRMQARRDLLGQKVSIPADEILAGPMVRRLLAGQKADGGFGGHPYHKWTGVHWRLVSLVELGVPAGTPAVTAALDRDLDWMLVDGRPTARMRIAGVQRVHASMHANPIACAVRLGMADDMRVRQLVGWLIDGQWADGGWNCDRHPAASHSSFYESVLALAALAEFARATGDAGAAQASRRAADFFLEHRVFKSHTADRPGDPKWQKLRYPEYWHYDYLHGLVMLMRAGALPDARAQDALDLLREQQQPDGRWVTAGAQYWRGTTGTYGDPASWNASSASQMLTLNALRVLKACS